MDKSNTKVEKAKKQVSVGNINDLDKEDVVDMTKYDARLTEARQFLENLNSKVACGNFKKK